jgi:DnaJ-class molecular chaperone
MRGLLKDGGSYKKGGDFMIDNFEIMMNPDKYGYEQCPHCNGYGSSLKDPVGVNQCTRCNGIGLVKKGE